MKRKINDKDRSCESMLKYYEDMSVVDIIEETLLARGCGIVSSDMTVSKAELEKTALYLYGLKASATNKLYVGLVIDRCCLQNDLASDKSDKRVRVPEVIYNKCKKINDSFKSKAKETVIDESLKDLKTTDDIIKAIESKMMDQSSYQKLIDGDIEWLMKNTEHSVERDHIIDVLKSSVKLYYKK